MSSNVTNILRSVYRMNMDSTEPLNILSICNNNEKYLSLLCQTQHNFYVINDQVWNASIEMRPSNLFTATVSTALDFVVCYDRAEQYAEAQNLARHLHIPIILVDMCSEELLKPHNILEDLAVHNISTLYRKPAIRICNSNYIRNSWNKESVSITVPLGVDTNRFQIVGGFGKTQGEIGLPSIHTTASITIDNNTAPQVGGEIARKLQNKYKILLTDKPEHDSPSVIQTQYFVNTNKTITVKLLEAMSAGNLVICLKNKEMENFIDNSKTGILINSLDELPATIESLEKNQKKKIQIAYNAREKIIKENSLDAFIKKWLLVFPMIKSSFYTPDT